MGMDTTMDIILDTMDTMDMDITMEREKLLLNLDTSITDIMGIMVMDMDIMVIFMARLHDLSLR